eukprot:scaffold322059_cov39-Prasinocladus_malaysianus.AAC.1
MAACPGPRTLAGSCVGFIVLYEYEYLLLSHGAWYESRTRTRPGIVTQFSRLMSPKQGTGYVAYGIEAINGHHRTVWVRTTYVSRWTYEDECGTDLTVRLARNVQLPVR